MKTKIVGLKVENVKRLKMIALNLDDGLNIIGGKNRQGKTSILDTIMSLTLGNSYVPTNAVRDGEKKGKAELELTNGVKISTSFTENGRTQLRISGIDTSRGPQTALTELFGEKALDVSRFLKASSKDKAEL